MKKSVLCFYLIFTLISFVLEGNVSGDTLAYATFDVDSYIHMGTNAYGLQNYDREGLAIGEDYSGGLLIDPDDGDPNSHIVFTVIRFDNLAGIQTRASGGSNKYLTLTTCNYPDFFPDTPIIGISVISADIDSDTDGYPIPIGQNPPFFTGNPTGGPTDRLQWYFDNIKGDNDAYGGYAGGATHVGILDVIEPGTYSIDVTTVVDGWIEGSINNFGFGLWGVHIPWPYPYPPGPGQTVEFASIENEIYPGPTLESLPVGDPIAGDFDSDGDVDGADFLIWQTGFGMQGGASPADGDATGDGNVDRDDFLIWEGNFGLSMAAGNGAGGNGYARPNSIPIPEPAAAGLVLLLIASSLVVHATLSYLDSNR